eukprot:1046469-Prorocentrum_lima.AAC.1
MPDGSWPAFMAKRFPPQELDDDIGKAHQEFWMAASQLTPEELLNEIPIILPMTHWLQTGGGHTGITGHTAHAHHQGWGEA